MYLRMLAKTLRPSRIAVFQHQQALLQEHQVGRLLGDVDRGIHRDPDVGGAQRRRIVDAVAQEAHHVLLALQGGDDALLVGGASRANRVVSSTTAANSVSLMASIWRAQQHVFGGDADLVADFLAHQLVVAGEHLTATPCWPAPPPRAPWCLWGIEEGPHSRAGPGRIRQPWNSGFAIQVAVGNRQHAKAVAGQTPVLFLQILDEHPLHGMISPYIRSACSA